MNQSISEVKELSNIDKVVSIFNDLVYFKKERYESLVNDYLLIRGITKNKHDILLKILHLVGNKNKIYICTSNNQAFIFFTHDEFKDGEYDRISCILKKEIEDDGTVSVDESILLDKSEDENIDSIIEFVKGIDYTDTSDPDYRRKTDNETLRTLKEIQRNESTEDKKEDDSTFRFHLPSEYKVPNNEVVYKNLTLYIINNQLKENDIQLVNFTITQLNEIYTYLYRSILSAEYLVDAKYSEKLYDGIIKKLDETDDEQLGNIKLPYLIRCINTIALRLRHLCHDIKFCMLDIATNNVSISNMHSTLKRYDKFYFNNFYHESKCASYHHVAKSLCWLSELDHNFHADYYVLSDLIKCYHNVNSLSTTNSDLKKELDKIKYKTYALYKKIKESLGFSSESDIARLGCKELEGYKPFTETLKQTPFTFDLWSKHEDVSSYDLSNFVTHYIDFTYQTRIENNSEIFNISNVLSESLTKIDFTNERLNSIIIDYNFTKANLLFSNKKYKTVKVRDLLSPIHYTELIIKHYNIIHEEIEIRAKEYKLEQLIELRRRLNYINEWLELANKNLTNAWFFYAVKPPFSQSFYCVCDDELKRSSSDDEKSVFVASCDSCAIDTEKVKSILNHYNRKSRALSDQIQLLLVKRTETQAKDIIKDTSDKSLIDIDKKIKTESDDIRRMSIQFLGIFAGFLAFVSSTVGLIKIATSIGEFIIFCIVFMFSITIFAFIIHYMHRSKSKEPDNVRVDPSIGGCLLTIVAIIAFIGVVLFCSWYYPNAYKALENGAPQIEFNTNINGANSAK